MKKDKFVSSYMDSLLKDDKIKDFLERAETDEDREILKRRLKRELEDSYETYAFEYFDSKGIGSYLSTFLRYTGAVTDAVGTYMFWSMGGLGFGVKGIGILEKTAADAIDAAYFARYAKTDSLEEKIGDEVTLDITIENTFDDILAL